VDLYVHFPIRLHGVVLNQLSTGSILPLSVGLLLMLTQGVENVDSVRIQASDLNYRYSCSFLS
jgi:hypothetical protein